MSSFGCDSTTRVLLQLVNIQCVKPERSAERIFEYCEIKHHFLSFLLILRVIISREITYDIEFLDFYMLNKRFVQRALLDNCDKSMKSV